MKTFCIAGPIIPENHYYIPQRLNRNDLDKFIDNKFYFILHAPRQSGKTSAVREYVNYVNKGQKYTALYLTTEPAHNAKNVIEVMIYWLLFQLKIEISDQLEDQKEAVKFLEEILKTRPVYEAAFYEFLHFWAQKKFKTINSVF